VGYVIRLRLAISEVRRTDLLIFRNLENHYYVSLCSSFCQVPYIIIMIDCLYSYNGCHF
jgi:hypothetical protein